MGEPIRHDALEIREDRLHRLALFGWRHGDLPEDVRRLRLRPDRPVAQAGTIIGAPVGGPM